MSYNPRTIIKINPNEVYDLASSGLGEASIAAMLGIGLSSFRKHLADNEEIRIALETGEMIAAEQAESTILAILRDASSTNRDKTAAFLAWAKYNKSLIKRGSKARLEALTESTTPELRAKLNDLIKRSVAPTLSDDDSNQDQLQLRLSPDHNP